MWIHRSGFARRQVPQAAGRDEARTGGDLSEFVESENSEWTPFFVWPRGGRLGLVLQGQKETSPYETTLDIYPFGMVS